MELTRDRTLKPGKSFKLLKAAAMGLRTISTNLLDDPWAGLQAGQNV